MNDGPQRIRRHAARIMSGWNLPGRARRPRAQEAGDSAAASYSRLALRLERDLALQDRGRSVLIAAVDDDAVGVEAVTELAWYLAEALGRTVLLVDGTFNVGALSTAFGIGDVPGLMDLLGAPVLDATTLRAHVQPTQHEDIALLPRGHGDNGRMIPARSEALRLLLEVGCETFDFVLVQGSLLNASSRSMAFGSRVDAALLVAVDGRSSVQEVERAQAILNDSGAERVGLVLASSPQGRSGGEA